MKVRYNGGTESYRGCSSPVGVLVEGKVYEVISEEVGAYQTNYRLEGIEGSFNSVWFFTIRNCPTYFALSKKVPMPGERFECLRIEESKNALVPVKTSIVIDCEMLTETSYKVTTRGSVYLVKII